MICISIRLVKQPAIKWTGSKRKVAPFISKFFPEHNYYFEPFLGGGSVILHSNAEFKYGSDNFAPLINIWNIIKNDPDLLISSYTTLWNNLQKQGHTYYYEVRDEYNRTKDPLLFNFLTRTCFNGTIRFSKEGKFNTSFHLTRKGIQPEKLNAIIKQWSPQLQNTSFNSFDYKSINEFFPEEKNDIFIYCDPPYLRANTLYFDSFDYQAFYLWLADLNTKGIKWMVSFDSGIKELQDISVREITIENQSSSYRSLKKQEDIKFQDSIYLNY